ncbi:MAG: putative selenate ABC transporter substrate-binding protein [Planctomycetes bacterium]|nr:putative selenate ABC transporter substrate-binding protein [Planctomycetota bacterium]
MKTLVQAALLGFACFTSSCGGESSAEAVLTFSAIPDHDQTMLRAKYEPVAEWLSEQLGVPVRYRPVVKYKDAVELFRTGDVQLAWFGGLSGVQARRSVEGARAIVQGAADPTYYSYFIAHKDTGLERSESFPKGIEGKKFTFGSPDSTSGRLMPEYFIRKYGGKAPADYFGHENAYSGAHDKTIEQVASGQFEVGACNYKTYDKMVADGKIDPAVCKVIWKSDLYADYNMTAHPDLEKTFGAGFIDKLQKTLLRLDDPELLAAFQRDRLIAASNEDFSRIEELAVELGLTD